MKETTQHTETTMNEEITEEVSKALTAFAKLVSEAPEGDDSQTGGQSDPRAFSEAKPNLVRLANGWGQKYVDPIELRGERWLAEFEDAKTAVAAGGIVLFLGKRGPGKTQMAAEVARNGNWSDGESVSIPSGNGTFFVAKSQSARYLRALDLFLDLREAAQPGSGSSEKKVLERLEKPGLLVIDEFQERGGTEWENRIVCNLIDKRYAANRPTIIIANLTREDMAKSLSPSILDRIRENGRAIMFDWESYRNQAGNK